MYKFAVGDKVIIKSNGISVTISGIYKYADLYYIVRYKDSDSGIIHSESNLESKITIRDDKFKELLDEQV